MNKADCVVDVRQVGVDQSTISSFANRDEAKIQIEEEQLKLVAVLPNTVKKFQEFFDFKSKNGERMLEDSVCVNLSS